MENDVSLKALDELCTELADAKVAKADLAALEKQVNEKIAELQTRIIAHLEEAELESFRGSRGLISVVNEFGVRTPKTKEEKKAFAKYLEPKGIFWEIFGVNSQTLNSFYKQEMQAAIAEGKDGLTIPGIDEPTHTKKISFRSKK